LNTDFVYLKQTQTTVGFLSLDDKKLNSIKKRSNSQKILCELDSFKTLLQNTRVPKKYRKMVRNSKLTTFIYPNKQSFRVVDLNSIHYQFLKKFRKLYSTSANITKEIFDYNYAVLNSDIIVEDNNGFSEKLPSKIYKLSNKKLKKIR
jgi:tRNA A37 threonylcarbamoyladenosine synthetase subunit TsaC/SUA5/YrdC